MQIVIVDDSPLDLVLLDRACRAAFGSPDVIKCAGPGAALRWLVETDPGPDAPQGFLVTDVNMPAMDGFELQSQIRQRCPSWQNSRYTVSGGAESGHAQRALAVGARAHEIKPMSFGACVEMMLRFATFDGLAPAKPIA